MDPCDNIKGTPIFKDKVTKLSYEIKCKDFYDNIVERFQNESKCGTKDNFNSDLPLYIRAYIIDNLVSKLMNIQDFQHNVEIRKEANSLFNKML